MVLNKGAVSFGPSGANHCGGSVPDPGAVAGIKKFLCENNTWADPINQGFLTSYSTTDLDEFDQFLFYYTAGSSPARNTLNKLGGLLVPFSPMHRLTLTSGTAVTTADVTAATTLYLTPQWGTWMCYGGHRWNLPEMSITPTLSANTNYDVCLNMATVAPSSVDTATDTITWSSDPGLHTGAVVRPKATEGGLTQGTVYFYRRATSTTGTLHGTLAGAVANTGKTDLTAILNNLDILYLVLLAWSSDTARATAPTITTTNQALTVAGSGLLIGTIRSTAASQMEDSQLKRFVWNLYNRAERLLLVTDPADTWTWATSAWHQANANAANKFEYVAGMSEDMLKVEVSARLLTGTGVAGSVGVGLGSTTVNSAQLIYDTGGVSAGYMPVGAVYKGYPGIGYRDVYWLEYRRQGTCTFHGDGGVVASQSGMIGVIQG